MIMWNHDNVIFNINGIGLEKLKLAIELAFDQNNVCGWKFNKGKGICLYSYDTTGDNSLNKFPTPIKPAQAANIVFDWLEGDEAKQVPCVGKDANADHDGSNELGWRVYTEDWGHVDEDWHVLCIKPAYVWYGK